MRCCIAARHATVPDCALGVSVPNSLHKAGFDELVPRIYDAVDHKSGLSAMVRDVAEWIGGPGTRSQMLVLESGRVVANHHCGLDPARFELYANHWMAMDPRMAAAVARPDTILSDTTDIDRRAFERSAIYNEALVPDDNTYTLFGNFTVGAGLCLAQAFMRGRREGAFEPRDVERMRALLPHLRCAARLSHFVGQLQDAQQHLLSAVDVLPNAVVLLDRMGRTLFVNRSAKRLLHDGGLLTPQGVVAASMAEARELSSALANTVLLAEVVRPGDGPAVRPRPVKLSRRGRSALWLLLYPLRAQSSLRQASHSARVLAILHAPGARVRIDPRLLVKLHDLTPTEAALASALAEGRTLSEFASARGCSELTARTHLKHVLEKTGTRRQAELVRNLLASATLHSLE